MRIGFVVSFVLVLAGLSLAIFAFVKNSSPMVTIQDAKKAPDRHVLVGANLVKDSIQSEPTKGLVMFTVQDEKTGETLPVVYKGFVPENMEEAKRVVVGGKMAGDHFECKEIQLKCPSKYKGKVKTDRGVTISADR